MGDGRTDLALDVVTDNRHAGFLELVVPFLSACDEHRQGVDECDLRIDCGLRVVFDGLLRANRQVAHQNVDLRVAQSLRNVNRLGVGFGDGFAVVLAEAVKRWAALHFYPGVRDVGDFDGVVLAGVSGFGNVLADLVSVDVERCDEFDVADVVVAELHVHESRNLRFGICVLVVFNAFDE